MKTWMNYIYIYKENYYNIYKVNYYNLIPCNVRVLRVSSPCGNTVFKTTRVSI